MKKYIVCILLLCASFSLYAQSNSAAVYVPPVTGTGSNPGDNEFFYKELVSEVNYQHFTLAKARKDAEFSLVGTLSPHPDNTPSGAKQYLLHLAILDNKTNKSRSDGELVYEAPEDIKSMFPSLVYTLLYTIPEGSGKDNWRNKWLFVGVSAFWTPRIYTSERTAAHLVNFGGGIFTEYHVWDYISVETGFELATDLTKVYAKVEENYSNLLLEIPILVKFVLKPGEHFILEAYGGVHFNIPFEKTTVPPAVSWMAGFQYGVKAGPGVLFIDPRFSMDIGESVMDPDSAFKEISFQRYILHIGIGYKLGLFTKR
jgi:hypothetical protein